jgi:hypothetical protein
MYVERGLDLYVLLSSPIVFYRELQSLRVCIPIDRSIKTHSGRKGEGEGAAENILSIVIPSFFYYSSLSSISLSSLPSTCANQTTALRYISTEKSNEIRR